MSTSSSSYLPHWAEQDLQLTLRIAGSPWIVDGPTRQEFIAIESLFRLNQTHPELASQLLNYTLETPVSDVNVRLIARVEDLVHDKPEQWQKITSQPWYVDGLTLEERAFVVALIPHWPDFDTLLQTRFTQSRQVALPLSGGVHLWAFQTEPFPAGEDVLRMVSEALQGLERLMQLPYPTDTVIVRFRVIHDPKSPSGYQTSESEESIRIFRYNNALLHRDWQRFRRTLYP